MIARAQNQVKDIIVVGVGGQGILLATDVIANAFMKNDYDVKKSEVHGMAQRGGSVQSHVRCDLQQVNSPLIPHRKADALLAFEKMEALRYAPAVKPDGYILYNTQQIPTVPMSTGQQEYPSDIDGNLANYSENTLPVDAMEEAKRLKNVRVVNTILIGALSRLTDVPQQSWKEAVLDRVPAGAQEVNEKAFTVGREVSENFN